MSNKTLVTQEQQDVPNSAHICENCHTPVDGMYCSQCGQSIESTLKYFWTVILHLLDDIFSFDSRSSRTLFPLVFRPGFLTREYIAGRRVHYVPPLRLYLFVSIIFFLTLKFFAVNDSTGILGIGNSKDNLQQVNERIVLLNKQKETATPDTIVIIEQQIAKFTTLKNDLSNKKNLLLKGMSSELVELEFKKMADATKFTAKQQNTLEVIQGKIDKLKAGEDVTLSDKAFKMSNKADGSLSFDFLSEENNKKITAFSALLTQKADKAFKEDPTPLIQEAVEKLPQLMFVLLPLFAALLKIIFIFSKRLYLEHLTVALHSHSFIFLIILLVEALSYLQNTVKIDYPTLADWIESLTLVLVGWIPIYLFVMQKKVYRQGYFLTAVKYSIIGSSYMLMISFTATIAFVWGLAST